MEQALSNRTEQILVDFAVSYSTPLDDDHIRLLRIHPEWLINPQFFSEGHAHIQVGRCRLSDLSKGEFCALSYCWGSDSATKLITVNETPILVQTNIYDFLLCWYRRILAGQESGYLWIDQFCINQRDPIERAREVQRMDTLYMQASMVVCWLGIGTKSSDEAMVFLHSLRNDPLVEYEDEKSGARDDDGFLCDDFDDDDMYDRRRRGVRACGGSFSDDEDSDSELPEHEQRYLSGLRAVCVLVARPYFRRMWCVQESALASKECTIMCGDQTASFTLLCRLWLRQLNSGWITFRQRYFPWDFEHDLENMNYEHLLEYDAFWSGNPLKFVGIVLRYVKSKSETGKAGCSFLSLLIATHHYMCKEPVDKFYSLLKLSLDADRLVPRVSYEQSFEAVSTSFVKAWILLYNRLDIIAVVFRDGVDDRKMPTWVTEWQRKALHNTLISRWPHQIANNDDLEHKPIYNADGGVDTAYRFWSSPEPYQMEVLLAVGLSCDVLYDLGEPQISAMNQGHGDLFPGSWRTVLERHIDRSKADLQLQDDLWKRFLSVMLGGRTPDGSPFDHKKVVVEVFEDEINFEVDLGNGKLGLETWMQPQWETVLSGRRFVVTKHGRMGLVPWFAQRGNEVVTIFGCSVPLVIHRLKDGTCKLIGDCYIEGMMRGEMIDAAGGPAVTTKKAQEILEEFDRLVKTNGEILPDELVPEMDRDALEPELFGIR